MTIRRTLLATTALALWGAMAPAQAGERAMYFDIGGGANSLSEQTDRDTAATAFHEEFALRSSSDAGFVVTAAVGAHLDNLMHGIRIELEGSYRHNSVTGGWASHTARALIGTEGDLEFDETTWAVMANAWYDIKLGSFQPYFGGGAGWAQTKLDGNYVSRPPSRLIDFSADGLAWQVGVGLNYAISPNMTIGVGYRYFSGPDIGVLPPNTNNHADGASIGETSQSVMLDLSFSL